MKSIYKKIKRLFLLIAAFGLLIACGEIDVGDGAFGERYDGPKCSHDWSLWTVTTPAECTTAGAEKRTCTNCPRTEKHAIPALGHVTTTGSGYVAATCTTPGNTGTGICTRCSEYAAGEVIPALEHNWIDNWTVTTPPTDTTQGVETRTCTRTGCSETQTRTIAALVTVIFNSNGGTAVSPLSGIVAGSTISEPVKPTRAFTGTLSAAGLYAGNTEYYTFDGWFNGETKWNFATDTVAANITLTARWSDPVAIDLTSVTGATVIDKAFDYINANPAAYTLLIDANISIAGDTNTTSRRGLNTSNAKLTLIGLGSERQISLIAPNGWMFTIGAAGHTDIVLTLGNNITLKGRNIATSWEFIIVRNGAELIMEVGSKITEVVGNQEDRCAVNVIGAVFTMNGGTITGNRNSSGTRAAIVGGVNTESISTIRLNGGTITGNTGNGGAVRDVHVNAQSSLYLSGSANVGALTLNASSTSARGSLSILTGWTGSVTLLNLCGNNSSYNLPLATAISYWVNVNNPVLIGEGVNATTIGRITLGNLMPSSENDTQKISDTHKLETTGADIGKLVLKYDIGATGPGGGIIFYRDPAGFIVQGYGNSGDPGYFAQYRAFYLEAAPADAGTLYWASLDSYAYNTNLTAAQAIGSGKKNTAIILEAAEGNPALNTPAVHACNIYTTATTIAGDWFLPSQLELNELYQLYFANGQGNYAGLQAADYWTSTNHSTVDITAIHISFSTGAVAAQNKSNAGGTFRVRPIRAF